jgi:hypothetical protein
MGNDDNNGGGAKVSVTVGGSFSTLLTIAFIVLKLCKVIDWSWVWVLSPIWITFALVLLLLLIYFLVFIIIIAKNK